MTNRPVIVVGSGGHARVVADTLRAAGRHVQGFTDIDSTKHQIMIDGLLVLGGDEILDGQEGKVDLANGLGSIASTRLRRRVFEKLKERGFNFATVIHPFSSVSAYATVSEGGQIFAGAVVQAGVHLGENVIINTGARVDHDCEIAAHSHIAPGAILSGAVVLGAGSHIGAGAVLKQGIALGEETVVGAGAVVVGNHPAQVTLIGIPAKARA